MAKTDRGFASMDPGKRRQIASQGGKAAHAKGTAHEWTAAEAREAGRKGGAVTTRRRQRMPEPVAADSTPTTPGVSTPSSQLREQ